jgi:hypothetical protein
MSRALRCTFVLFLLLPSLAVGQTRKTTGAKPTTKQKQPASFVEKVLKFLGISDSPDTLKGPGDEVVSGQLWLAELDSKSTHAVSAGGGYRSPIFAPGSNDILALRGTDVWRFASGSAEAKKLSSVSAINKLVASSADDPEKVLILLEDGAGGHRGVGLLSISTGKVTPVPYDSASSRDLQMVENLQDWTRTYGDKQTYVRRQTKQALSGPIEWTDVYFKVGSQAPVDISQCNGVNCGQPSMSADGRLLVFVKTEAE